MIFGRLKGKIAYWYLM